MIINQCNRECTSSEFSLTTVQLHAQRLRWIAKILQCVFGRDKTDTVFKIYQRSFKN